MKRTATEWAEYIERRVAPGELYMVMVTSDASHLAALLRAMVAEREARETFLVLPSAKTSAQLTDAIAARRRAEGLE
jgi:hypothetical protein